MNFRPIASSSAGNAYALECSGHPPLLIEAGIPWPQIQKAFSFKVSKAAGVLVSHSHGDHARSALDAARAGLDVYVSPGTFRELVKPESELRSRFRNVVGGAVMVGPWKCGAFAVEHDTAEPVGFLVEAPDRERLVYLTDTAGCAIEFHDINYFCLECNHDAKSLAEAEMEEPIRARIAANHMSLERCVEFLRLQNLSKVKAIWLLHLSESRSDAAAYKQAVAKATGRPVYIADAHEQPPAESGGPAPGDVVKITGFVKTIEHRKSTTGASVLALTGLLASPVYVSTPSLQGYFLKAETKSVTVEAARVAGVNGKAYFDVVHVHRIGDVVFTHDAPAAAK